MSKRARWSWWAVLAAGFVGLGGCVQLPKEVNVAQGFGSPATLYGRTLQRHTRKAELYQGFDTVGKGWATWRRPELRQALAETSIQAFGLGQEAADAMRKEEERRGREVREFHLALYTPKAGWNDLESPESLWRSHLLLPGGERIEPLRVTYRPKTDKSAVEYPYVTPWTREYSLVFPLSDGDEVRQHLTLVLAGPLGTMRFEY